MQALPALGHLAQLDGPRAECVAVPGAPSERAACRVPISARRPRVPGGAHDSGGAEEARPARASCVA